jgi:hypothetical protein
MATAFNECTLCQVLFCGHLEVIRLPHDPTLRPHPGYIARHRERFVG